MCNGHRAVNTGNLNKGESSCRISVSVSWFDSESDGLLHKARIIIEDTR